MTRLFTFFLLLLITAATVTPCCLYDDCGSEDITAHAGDEKKSEGGCSPFSFCSACSGFVWTARTVQLQSPGKPFIRHIAKPHVHNPQTVYTTFWQPPRVA